MLELTLAVPHVHAHAHARTRTRTHTTHRTPHTTHHTPHTTHHTPHTRTCRVLQGDPAFYNLLSVYDLLFTNDADGNGVRPRPDYQARWFAAHEANMAAYNTSVIVGFFLGACAARMHHADAGQRPGVGLTHACAAPRPPS